MKNITARRFGVALATAGLLFGTAACADDEPEVVENNDTIVEDDADAPADDSDSDVDVDVDADEDADGDTSGDTEGSVDESEGNELTDEG